MFRIKDENVAPINLNESKIKCSYCGEGIKDENYLYCLECLGYVHVKCLRHSSTPGDLMGDVFFDFTCAKCMQLQYDGPSTSQGCAKEKFIRQRLPWIMVITLTLYNLSIKFKGLSHHGYFHWKTHVVNFIEKNWDYLFEPNFKKKRQWVGSVTGNMSHNSPEFFLSGQDAFGEPGWWKLTHDNKHPRYIYSLYEQFSQKRSMLKNGKRQIEDANETNVEPSIKEVSKEVKRLRMNFAEEDLLFKYSCSRAIPYMGRKPRIRKHLNTNKNKIKTDKEAVKNAIKNDQEPLNTVQSSLMDFLAESLASDDLTLFNNLPNIAAEPLVCDNFEKNDFLLSSLSEANENGDMNDIGLPKTVSKKINNNEHKDVENFQSFYKQIELEDISQDSINLISMDENTIIDPTFHNSEENISKIKEQKSALTTEKSEDFVNINASLSPVDLKVVNKDSIDSNDSSDDDDDCEELMPRIVQVTNFQQLDADPEMLEVKLENLSDDGDEKIETEEAIKSAVKNIKNEIEIDDDLEDTIDDTPLPPCQPSLFTKHPKREDPWLSYEKSKKITSLNQIKNHCKDKDIKMMNLYEERSLLKQLTEIFEDEHADELELPAYLRRFYRKLCVREWKRQHSQPLFDIDNFVTGTPTPKSKEESLPTTIDQYSLLCETITKPTATFRARLAGSCEYELFQSPFTGRILHPFIYRNSKCLPKWLKLMLEVKYCVTGIVPDRAPIDFCYVRPNHIPAVNALLESLFWPGIDMSECLSYPDYSIIALYKKLVIGCGFIVPDAGFNEAYISFMAVRPCWQNSGIGTFMLYHLIQTCLSKDIVLHVSATNPAVLLYQKFGFKIQKIVLNFYDKYLPFESKQSRTALYLRLNR